MKTNILIHTILIILSYYSLSSKAQTLYGSPHSLAYLGPQSMLSGYNFFSSGIAHSQEMSNNLIARSGFSFNPAAKNISRPFGVGEGSMRTTKSRYPYRLSDAHHLALHSSYGISLGAFSRLNTANEFRVRGTTNGNDKFQIAGGILLGYQENFDVRGLAKSFADLYLAKPFTKYNNIGLKQENEKANLVLASYNYLAFPFAYSRRGLKAAAGKSKHTKRQDHEFIIGITPYLLNGSSYGRMQINRMQIVPHTEDKTMDISGNLDYWYNKSSYHYSLNNRLMSVWENNYGYRLDCGATYEIRRAMTVIDSSKNEKQTKSYTHLTYRRTLLFSATLFNLGGISYKDVSYRNYSISALKQDVIALRKAAADAIALDSSLMQSSNFIVLRKYAPEWAKQTDTSRVWHRLPAYVQLNSEVRLPFSTHWYASATGRFHLNRQHTILNTYGGSLRYESKAMGVGVTTMYNTLTNRYSTGIQGRVALTRSAGEQVDEKIVPVLEFGLSNVLAAALTGEKYAAGVYMGFSCAVSALDRSSHPSIMEEQEQELVALRFKNDRAQIRKAALEVRQKMLTSSIGRTKKRLTEQEKRIQRVTKEKAVRIKQDSINAHTAFATKRIDTRILHLKNGLAAMKESLESYEQEEKANAKHLQVIDEESALYSKQYQDISGKKLNNSQTHKWKVLLNVVKDVLRLSVVFW